MSRRPGFSSVGPIVALVLAVATIAGALASIPYLRQQRSALRAETQVLRERKTTAAQTMDSLQNESASIRATLQLEQARAAARDDPKLHLVIAVDSGTVALVRDGITLRSMPARFRGAAPARGTQSIAAIEAAAVQSTTPTVDSLGNAIPVAPESLAESVTLTDGTVIEGGDAAAVLLGGLDVAPGPRLIILSRRDFAAMRPNLVRGMKAVLF